MKKTLSTFFFTIAIVLLCHAQSIATLSVTTGKAYGQTDVPVHLDLDALTTVPDSMISLFETTENKRITVPCQVENKGHRVLYWLLHQPASSAAEHTYQLVKGKPVSSSTVNLHNDSGYLTITAHGKKLLRYNYKTVYPPKGVDTVFKRSGFIHPLWSPGGQVLTRIGAPDHYHHFGLWDAWAHTYFDGDTVDFWNLIEHQGTVRFANFTSVTSGPVYGEYQALQQYIAFKRQGPDKGTEKVALNELQTVRIYQPAAYPGYYIADITIQLNCADLPITLLTYRYGGLGWRATELWNGKNSEMLTAEGKPRDEADGTKSRWVIVQGAIGDANAGAVMMSYPINYNYPEPLRVWKSDMNGRGDVYANFSPTKDKDWPLIPGRDYVLRYRFVVFNGRFDKQKAEAAWQAFANPPQVTVVKASSVKL